MLRNRILVEVVSIVLKNQFYIGLGVSFLLSSGIGVYAPANAISLVNTIVLPGDLPDRSGQPAGANGNRVGFFSDLYYDRFQNLYYALGDRGPGGGVISYETRLQKFTLDVNPTTGAIRNFNIIQTILFTRNGTPFNGLNPLLFDGDKASLGNSFDPEGFTVAPDGNFYISDEYGPSLYEFNPDGEFIRAFTLPNNILPRQSDNRLNFVDGRPTITTGRQDNRGFEGLAITPDGSRLLAMLQDPLVNEGNNSGSPDGRRSRNLRIVEFDTATGTSTRQFIYQLEALADINARIPGTTNDFGANAQGRNIGISAIIAVNNDEFLVLERDNRGLGVDTPAFIGSTDADPVLNIDPILPVGSKRVFTINLNGATDVSAISLAGTNDLPGGVTPVSKSLFLDIQAVIASTGGIIPEKFEGITIGPRLNDGSYAFLAGTDNDFSVTQIGGPTQFNVCTSADNSEARRIPLTATCPAGFALIPGFLYSFKTAPGDLANFVPPSTTVPEPNTVMALLAIGFGSLVARRSER